MKTIALIVITTLIGISVNSKPKDKKAKTLKLSSYILPLETIKELKGPEQVAYFVFLNHFVSAMDHILRSQIFQKDLSNKSSDKSAALFHMFEHLLNSSDFKMLPHAVAKSDVPNLDYIPLNFNSILSNLKNYQPYTSALDTYTPPAISENYRKAGETCLYGGHISSYKKYSTNKILCQRPKKMVNNKLCKSKSRKTTFLCNSFGLQNSTKMAGYSPQVCVGLYSDGGINTLTTRCAAAVLEWFKTNPPSTIHTLNYTHFRNDFTKILNNFETKIPRNSLRRHVSFSDYCANGNLRNKARQKAPCEAVTTLIAKLRKGIVNFDQRNIANKHSFEPAWIAPTSPPFSHSVE